MQPFTFERVDAIDRAIGSRGTIAERHAALRAAGVTAADLARIHAPIGLDLGGRTPAEIALAILAEIVAVRYGRAGGMLKLHHEEHEGHEA